MSREDELRDDIDATREDLAETVDALIDKVDPRVRARRAADSLRRDPVSVGIAAASVAALVAAIVLWRHR